MTDTYTHERQYMPRRTKKMVRVCAWLMGAGFMVGVALLVQDGFVREGITDWQKFTHAVQQKFSNEGAN